MASKTARILSGDDFRQIKRDAAEKIKEKESKKAETLEETKRTKERDAWRKKEQEERLSNQKAEKEKYEKAVVQAKRMKAKLPKKLAVTKSTPDHLKSKKKRLAAPIDAEEGPEEEEIDIGAIGDDSDEDGSDSEQSL